jgi:hypothetical protein
VRVATAEEAATASRGIADFTDLGIVADAGSAPLPCQAAGEVHGIRARSNGFDLHVISGGGIVVSSVSYDPAWKVEIDRRAAPVLEADSGFLGFAVPAGAHQVTIDYRPSGWTRGVALCGAGLLASAMLGVRGAASRRHRRRQPAPAGWPAGEVLRPAAAVAARGWARIGVAQVRWHPGDISLGSHRGAAAPRWPRSRGSAGGGSRRGK